MSTIPLEAVSRPQWLAPEERPTATSAYASHIVVVIQRACRNPYEMCLPCSCRAARALRTGYAIPAISVVEASLTLVGGVMLERKVNRRSSASSFVPSLVLNVGPGLIQIASTWRSFRQT